MGPDGEVHVYTLDFGNGDRILDAYDLHDEDSFQPGDRISVTGAPSRFENDPRMLVFQHDFAGWPIRPTAGHIPARGRAKVGAPARLGQSTRKSRFL